MLDREKVIRGLEACNRQSYNGSDCQNCPYYDDEDTAELAFGICNIQDMFDDALAILKEQEPRVMDDALLLEYDGAVWLENKRDTGTILSICKSADDRQFRFFSKNEWENVAYLRENYGKTWRCWTSRPTEEQRKAVPWEDDDAD